jgi:hypothetical protein
MGGAEFDPHNLKRYYSLSKIYTVSLIGETVFFLPVELLQSGKMAYHHAERRQEPA